MNSAEIFEYLKDNKIELLIVSDDKEALIARDIASFLGYKVFVLPDFRANFGDDLLSFSEELKQISTSLNNYHNYTKKNKLLISPIRTITYKLPKKECFSTKKIAFGDTINLDEFKTLLYNWGYIFVDIVESEGEVSIRGDIIDIFIVGEDEPIRISLFDVEVESIRYFDIQNQKSYQKELEEIILRPAFLALDEQKLSLLNQKLKSNQNNIINNIHSLGFWYLDELGEFYTQKLTSVISNNAINEIDEVYIFDNRIDKNQILQIPKIPPAKKYQPISPTNIAEFLQFHKDKKITIISNTQTKLKSLELPSDIKYHFINSYEIINLISDKEVIISLNKEVKKRKKKKPNIILDELQKGEFVVHEVYGIGKFIGIEPISIMGGKRDFVTILYANDDKLYVPVENIDIIDRYVADSGAIPTLDKLGKGSFTKLKEKVKEKLFKIANEIIELAAIRQLQEGIKINIDKNQIKLFWQKAGFEYTPDQKQAIKEIFEDLSSGKIMDRLLSGDVGFGKTEVAMNAIFAVSLNNYKSLFICPTTILANQHFHSLKDRFEPFGIKVAKIDGKTKPKEKKAILQDFASNKLHVIVGTHALLNIKEKSLALVVIDEEHKFGVKQKEKLKNFKNEVHILSMSATPIPRTLNLALSQIKSLSQLKTPPKDRIGVRSFVKEYDKKIIKEAILRELRRGGQIFYIYNNIATINLKQKALLQILPNLKIEILHSKISPKESERILLDFADKKFDLLLSTSIVESGLHLPNANTIIIDGANNFGIADLHQLRGRVGRGDKEGFCYFLIQNKSSLTDSAIKRLVAIERNSYLGSGYALAYQDLEIRGGGNILGEAQSGQIKQIGYGLYLKMLEDAILTLSGKTKQAKQTIELKLSINAYLSNDFIQEDRLRLDAYRRLSKATDTQQIYQIADELEDRFGKFDEVSYNFIKLMIIKLKALQQNIKQISNYNQNITFIYNDNSKKTFKAYSKDDDDILKAILNSINPTTLKK